MAGVKTLLKAAANDMEQTVNANEKPHKESQIVAKPMAIAETPPLKAEPSRKSASKAKHPGGRPTNKEKGIQSRKQYTFTLKEETYKLIMEKAGEEDLSFAKFVERAALEYIENH